MALKQGRMRETRKKKSGSVVNHWMASAGRSASNKGSRRAMPKPLPRRIAM